VAAFCLREVTIARRIAPTASQMVGLADIVGKTAPESDSLSLPDDVDRVPEDRPHQSAANRTKRTASASMRCDQDR
jgi:hypothetical protein